MDIKKLGIGIAIFILTFAVAVYGINTFYERPQYDDYCGAIQTAEYIDNAQRCEQIGGQWRAYDGNIMEGEQTGWCDRMYTCSNEYQDARDAWTLGVFLIGLPLALLLLGLGALLFKVEAIGSGIMGGGLITLVYSTWGYFWNSNDKIRFIISLVGLIILVSLTYWFYEKRGKKKVSKKRR